MGWRRTMSILIVVALAYLVVSAMLYVGQRSLIYYPRPRAFGDPASTLALPTAAGDVLVTIRGREGPRALLYFGGNAEDTSRSLPELASAFPDHALFLMHYRGYGGSAGQPTEQALFADALALYDLAQPGRSEMVVIGRSLGSGVATYLASRRPIARLVLVTPFDSLAGVVGRNMLFAPFRWVLSDPFESTRYAREVQAATLIIAAEHDEVVPRASTDELLRHFRPGIAKLAVVPGASHNAIEYLALARAALKPAGDGSSSAEP